MIEAREPALLSKCIERVSVTNTAVSKANDKLRPLFTVRHVTNPNKNGETEAAIKPAAP